jgi:hypothetical protein
MINDDLFFPTVATENENTSKRMMFVSNEIGSVEKFRGSIT